TTDMADKLVEFLGKLCVDSSIRVVMLSGEGRSFCAGADVSKLTEFKPAEAVEFHRKLNKVCYTISTCSKPVVAVLHGYVLGGGLEIAEWADIRIAADNAKIGQPEVNIGLNGGAGGTIMLPRLVGRGVAAYLAMTGEIVDAKYALSIGLVDLVVESAHLTERARELGMKLSSKPPATLRAIKQALSRFDEMSPWAGLEYEAQLFGHLFSEEETKRRFEEFLKKKA
ncbi:MAG: enoyl-CoA hydratase/isomerase family protein, partial [Thermoprotei archaeon]